MQVWKDCKNPAKAALSVDLVMTCQLSMPIN